ncbi:acyl transferase domain-containing protein [Phyllobacterium myrsinacearum]|uniref:type I polyketide synthase n=1 Tax=Phyllobacterium myrsinacearum TaxID=28101 RepID=UPI001028999A|nr:type I polyketide synthase [Phyllobacterium myrsinacearum]RZS76825.1 acyl transferase domain-containing protein [Phyllobacterium myrsinacearum]
MNKHTSDPQNLLAIVAIGCRYPGGIRDVDSFWDTLVGGVDTVCEVPPDRWDLRKYYDPRPKIPGKMYVREGAFLTEDIWQFDPNYFGIGPLEAERLDPQQRLLLKVTLEALESGNITKQALSKAKTGVYVGCFSTDNVVDASSTENKLHLIATQSHTCGVVTMLSARLSYHFGLDGACMSVDTACSSSLVAFHLACQAIRNGEIDQALVGGVNVMFRPEFTTTMCFGGFLAKDGRCKTFSAKGDGYGRGEGAGVLLVKPYEQALADGNEIFAVICGTGVNQDGHTNGITVPNEHAQLELMRSVARQAGVAPSQIGYAEAHGTGTAVGDPKEAFSLGSFLREGRDPDAACYVGSVKTNIGHQEAGAGIAGIIKAALCLKHAKVVPNLHFEFPNPAIDFNALQLSVPTEVTELNADYACVNSFGFGGTNAHAILLKPPRPLASPATRQPVSTPAEQPFLLPVSARSEASLKKRAAQYAAVLEQESINDLRYTVGRHRDHENVRAGLVVSSLEEAKAKLHALSEQTQSMPDVFQARVAADANADVVFLFTGMGPQTWAMGSRLMQQEPVFAQAITRLDGIFTGFSDWSLVELFSTPENFGQTPGAAMDEPRFAQPANLALQLALADVWRSKGVVPNCIVGHSVGEIAAACVAGALSEEAALFISYQRGNLHQGLVGSGTMLAVGMTTHEVLPFLSGKRVSIAAINSPSSLTLSGISGDLDAIAALLDSEGVFNRRLQVKVPYHSMIIEATRRGFFEVLGGIQPSSVRIPLYSTLTGEFLDGSELNCDYWWRNSREAVQFYAALDKVLDAGYRNFIEVGPHPVLRGALLEILKAKNIQDALCVESLNRKEDDLLTLERSLAALYVHGAKLDWSTIAAIGKTIALPAYPWDEQRYALFQDSPHNERLLRGNHPLLQEKHDTPGDSWRTAINRQFFPWLDDHKIQGHPILPGAAYAETMLACASLYGKADDSWAIRDVQLSSIQPTEENAEFSVKVDNDTVSIHARALPSDAWEPRASGRMVKTPPHRHFPAIDLPQDIKDCRVFEQDVIYRTALKNGYGFGPKFQVVKRFFVRDNVIFGHIDATHLGDEVDDYLIHPIMLDGIFQILNGVYVADMPAAKHGQYLPAGVNEIRLFKRGIRECWVRCEIPVHAGRNVDLDISVHDLDGAVIAEILGYRSKVVSAGDKAQEKIFHGQFYTVGWDANPWPVDVPATDAADDGRWLVFADEGGVHELWADESRRCVLTREPAQSSDALRKQIDDILDTEEIVGVVYGWALDAGVRTATADTETGIEDCAVLLQIFQALAVRQLPGFQKVIVLADGAMANEAGHCRRPGHAAMVGLCRTAKVEHPELGATLVDLGGTALEQHQAAFLLSSAFQDHEVVCGHDEYRISRVASLEHSSAAPLPAETVEDFALSVSARGGTDSLHFVERQRRTLSPADVEIEVRASALNFKDLMKVMGLLDAEYIEGTYFGDTIGMECSGVISRVGDAVTHLKIGDAVVAGAADSFAKYVVLPGEYVFKKPSTLTFAEAVIPFINTMPAYFGLIEKANLKRGDKVLIHSATGGVGLAAIQVARMVGAEVYATAGNEEKRQYLRDLGVKFVSDSRSLAFYDDMLEWTGGKGVDVVLNFLTGELMEKSVELLAFGGRFVELGKFDILADNRLRLGLFQKNISFTHVDFDYITTHCPDQCVRLMNEILQLYEHKQLLPIKTTTYPARRVRDAFEFMKTSEHIGKLVLDMSDQEGLKVTPMGKPLHVRPDGLYLITGGFSDLGLKAAQWLVDRGARHLGLIGRSGAKSDRDRLFISTLRDHGVDLIELQADVSRSEDVTGLLAQLSVPVRGVLHLATVYHDLPLIEQKDDELRSVMGVKAKGAYHLLQSLDRDHLDWFINFSSLASYGSYSQASYAAANTYLDALSHHAGNRTRVLSINWGPILAGEVDRNARLVRYFAESGIIPIAADDIFPMLDEVAKTPFNQVGAFNIDWERFAKNSGMSKSQLFAHQAASLQQSGGNSLIEQLHALDGEQQRDIAEDFIGRHLSEILHVPREKITAETRMDELGVDSLMAVTLSHAIEVDSLVELGAVAFLQKPTVRKLAAQWLSKRLMQHSTSDNRIPKAETWVRLSAPQTARMRLLCFPGVGMNAYGFADLADALSDIEVFGAHYPAGVERPDEAVESMEALGQWMAAAVADLPPGQAPLAILGHSFGGLVAYETAYALQQSGTPVTDLILAAPGIPHAQHIFDEAEGKRAWSTMDDTVASQARHLTAIRDLSADYIIHPEERSKIRQPLTLILASHDEYFNNDKLERWAEFAVNTASHYVDAGHHLLSHPEVAALVGRVGNRLSPVTQPLEFEGAAE